MNSTYSTQTIARLKAEKAQALQRADIATAKRIQILLDNAIAD